MRIRCGEYEVYATGCAQCFNENPITITLDDPETNTQPTFTLQFEDDRSEKESMQFRKVASREFKISLFNFSKSIGSGSRSPLKLGRLYGRELFFSYRINTIQNSTEKLLYYTWYLGAKTSEKSLYIEI